MEKITLVAIAALGFAGCCGCGPRCEPVAPPPVQASRPADAGDWWRFKDGAVGALPADFRVVEGQWAVAEETAGRGLLQQAKNANPVFNVVLIDRTRHADLGISVHVHALTGELDQGGGPVWRAQDGRNYYIARWNPLEDNCRVYKVVDGVRTQLGSATTKPGSSSRVITVRMTGSEILCELDGAALLRVEDTTFPAAGAIGLWTKADARTLFTDLKALGDRSR